MIEGGHIASCFLSRCVLTKQIAPKHLSRSSRIERQGDGGDYEYVIATFLNACEFVAIACPRGTDDCEYMVGKSMADRDYH